MSAHIRTIVRPDGRCLLRPVDQWTPVVAAAAVALADRLDRLAIAHVDELATDQQLALLEAGFAIERREQIVRIAVDSALKALRGGRVPAGVEIRSVADVDEDRLRHLDDDLRQDVPGTFGWRSTASEFRDHTFADPAFDPRTYLVAVDGSGAYLGLVRIWMNPEGPRLGLVGVRRGHRRRGLASALLARAFAAVRSLGHTHVQSTVDPTNRPSQTLHARLGARPLRTTLEFAYEPRSRPRADFEDREVSVG